MWASVSLFLLCPSLSSPRLRASSLFPRLSRSYVNFFYLNDVSQKHFYNAIFIFEDSWDSRVYRQATILVSIFKVLFLLKFSDYIKRACLINFAQYVVLLRNKEIILFERLFDIEKFFFSWTCASTRERRWQSVWALGQSRLYTLLPIRWFIVLDLGASL